MLTTHAELIAHKWEKVTCKIEWTEILDARIQVEDVQKILKNNEDKWIDWVRVVLEIDKEINSLPSINPETMIEEMIEETHKSNWPRTICHTAWIVLWTLEEALSRITKQ